MGQYLPKVYEILIRMDQFAFPFNLQAQLAADLIADKQFNANADQLAALKMGLGLRKPSKSFWAPIGQYTAAMDPEAKVNLLAHLVPKFGPMILNKNNHCITLLLDLNLLLHTSKINARPYPKQIYNY